MSRRLVQMGRALQSRIKEFFDTPLDNAATPLELIQAVLEDIERQVQPIGRGCRAFPYNRILVRIGPMDADRPSLEAAFERLDSRLRTRLMELQCAIPEGLDVRVAFVKRAPLDWRAGQLFCVEYRAQTGVSTATQQPAVPRPLQVTVVKGAATRKCYTFAQSVVSIGRTAEPADERGRVRRNDVVFADAVDGVTETVGRAHARLQFELKTREYRLFDEGSSNPTLIIRAGTAIQVPPHDPRGVRVRSGDEIQLGRAAVRLSIQGE